MSGREDQPGPDDARGGVNDGDLELRLAGAVGVLTALSGLGLVIAPKLVLRILGARDDHPAPFLFRVVGMFMTITGGTLADTVRAGDPPARALRWAALAKVGATVMVLGGVRARRLGRLALALAAFDGAAAVLLGRLARRAD